jgi:hypothetical protein
VISQTYFVWFKFLSIELCIMTQNTVFFMTLQKNVYLAAVEWKVLRCWLGQGNFLSTHPYTYLDHKPLIYSLPCSWDQRCMPWHLDYLLRWGLDNYSPPGLSLNYNPPNLHLLSSHGIQLFFIHSWRSLLCLHFFFLVGLVFELRASHLQTKHSTPWATPPVHFALVILETGSTRTIWP